MKRKLAIVAAVLSMGAPVFGHRLDEYLQATMISVEKDHVEASMRLIPGVAVFSTVLASIDSNHDGVISVTERQAYAHQVLRDIAVTVDDHAVAPRLLSANFPTIRKMKEGLGEIQIEFRVDLPRGGAHRKVVVENRHQSRVAAYPVNCLTPRDGDIRVLAQHRNENQSFYQLEFAQGGGSSAPLSSGDRWSGFGSLFRLGIRHIAEGTDHLLFLLVLLLPSPLIVVQRHWAGLAGVRDSVLRISKVVTAFTIGHSISLALAALGVVRAPARPIELLIAVSILVSAAHAMRPLFPGGEAAIAGLFGLIHGLAFAAALGQLGLDPWQRVAGILGFNLGGYAPVGLSKTSDGIVAATTINCILENRRRSLRGRRVHWLDYRTSAGRASFGRHGGESRCASRRWDCGGFIPDQRGLLGMA